MIEASAQDFGSGDESDRTTRTVVRAETGAGICTDHLVPFANRLRADADGNRVHVGHQKTTWTTDGARQDADKIARIPLEGCPFLNLIRRDPTRFGTRRPKMAYQVIRHICFSTTVAWNRHEFHDSLYCSVLVKTHHRDPESEGQMASCQLQSSWQLMG